MTAKEALVRIGRDVAVGYAVFLRLAHFVPLVGVARGHGPFGQPFLALKAGAWLLFAVVVYLALRGAARAFARA